MSYAVYKVLHLLGVMALLFSLGGMTLQALAGAPRATGEGQPPAPGPGRGLLSALHGVGMLLLLVAGFGALAKLGAMQGGLPGWVWGKLVVWLLLGGAPALIKRKPELGVALCLALPLLGGLAAFLAVVKPGT